MNEGIPGIKHSKKISQVLITANIFSHYYNSFADINLFTFQNKTKSLWSRYNAPWFTNKKTEAIMEN